MSPLDIPTAVAEARDEATIDSNREAALFAIEQSAKAQRLAALVQLPVQSDTTSAEIVGVPLSVFYNYKRAGDCPEFFKIGRREFCLTTSLIRWLEAKAKLEAAPGNKQVRRRKAEAGT